MPELICSTSRCRSSPSPNSPRLRPINPTVPGALVSIDFSREICPNTPCTCGPRPTQIYVHFAPSPFPLSAARVICESEMTRDMAETYLAAARLYLQYLESLDAAQCSPKTAGQRQKAMHPDDFFLAVHPDMPPSIFDWLDTNITPLSEIRWPDLDELYSY
ncbi:hypothetical protein HWV62_10587 [Athelia sp. TMB]|nr:hypothetical protein HWV62_10587 [Athelia sp. TMB]